MRVKVTTEGRESGREDFVGEPMLAFERYSSSGVNVPKHVLAHKLVYFEDYLEFASCLGVKHHHNRDIQHKSEFKT